MGHKEVAVFGSTNLAMEETVMAFRQVSELLDWIVDFHQQLGAMYTRRAGEQRDERMTMALKFLANRERRMHDSMKRYVEDADPALLKTWLIDSQDFVHPKMLERVIHCVGCQDVSDILANVLTAHQTLRDMYRLRAELAQIPSEQALFEELADNQEAEARLQARDIGRLEMY